MTGPRAGVDRLPGWQRRLLKVVQDLSYEHVRVLTYEFPTYFPGSEGGDLPMRIWRDQLGDVHSQRMQARLRAIDAGIPRETVDAAAEVAPTASAGPTARTPHHRRNIQNSTTSSITWPTTPTGSNRWRPCTPAARRCTARYARTRPRPGCLNKRGAT